MIKVVADEPPPIAKKPDEKQVDLLISQLVSTQPSPKRISNGFTEKDWNPPVRPEPYITPQVKAAIEELKKLGPPIYPWLVKYLKDERYSYSTSEALNGPPQPMWYDQSIACIVMDILSDGHEMYGGYLMRDGPSGMVPPTLFANYLDSKGVKKWAEWAKNKTLLEIQFDFLDVAIANELKAGFKDEKQRKQILQEYEEERLIIRKEYSEKGSTTKQSQR